MSGKWKCMLPGKLALTHVSFGDRECVYALVASDPLHHRRHAMLIYIMWH